MVVKYGLRTILTAISEFNFNPHSTTDLNYIGYVFLQEMKHKLEVEWLSLGDLFQT